MIKENLTHLEASGLAYDAIWAIALGLHTASMRLKAGDDSGCENIPGTLKQSLEEFDYSNKKMGCVLQESIAKVNFTGITVSGTKHTDHYAQPFESVYTCMYTSGTN